MLYALNFTYGRISGLNTHFTPGPAQRHALFGPGIISVCAYLILYPIIQANTLNQLASPKQDCQLDFLSLFDDLLPIFRPSEVDPYSGRGPSRVWLARRVQRRMVSSGVFQRKRVQRPTPIILGGGKKLKAT